MRIKMFALNSMEKKCMNISHSENEYQKRGAFAPLSFFFNTQKFLKRVDFLSLVWYIYFN